MENENKKIKNNEIKKKQKNQNTSTKKSKPKKNSTKVETILKKEKIKKTINNKTNQNTKKQPTNVKETQPKGSNDKVVVKKKSTQEKNQEANIEQLKKKTTKQTLNDKTTKIIKVEEIIKSQTEEFTNKTEKTRKKINIRIIIILIIVLLVGTIITGLTLKAANERKKIEIRNNQLAEKIKKHYNNYVITNKEALLYLYDNNKYKEVGKIAKEVELSLEEEIIDYHTIYFKITNLSNEYYISYEDVTPIDEISLKSDRYKKYIPYNKNIITKNKINLYNSRKELIYALPEKLNTPIIINDDNFYGIEYNGELLFIKNEDIEKIEESKNTDKKSTQSIATLNYHFFYDASDPSDSCNQGICLSTQNLRKHLDYIKNNNIFTPTMKEFEMYIDGKIQLPKSIVLTIDDGWRAGIGSKVITEYKLNATIFLMSKYYDPRNYQNEYIEVHSHGDDLHNPGICPGGQGGAIKCLEKAKLLEDLKSSREKLNNTTYFCYPFYEYNDYSINTLKEAGFTMAFGGPDEGGYSRAFPGINKFKIPRYIIMNYTTAADIANYIG